MFVGLVLFHFLMVSVAAIYILFVLFIYDTILSFGITLNDMKYIRSLLLLRTFYRFHKKSEAKRKGLPKQCAGPRAEQETTASR